MTGKNRRPRSAATAISFETSSLTAEDADQTSKKSKRFLVGPTGCEITGLAYTPDLKTFFVNIQHPTGNWPIAGEQPRSSTVVITRTDGKPVGA